MSKQSNATGSPQHFIMTRELSEVHLLLDNLSANPDKSLAEISKDLPYGIPPDWIERICGIDCSATTSPKEQAEDAALLVRVKDFLNSFAKPASGATIAFTLLVTREDSGAEQSDAGGKQSGVPTRYSLASSAFPGLVSKAEGFRLGMVIIRTILVVGLILTCLLSWYTAFGSATIAQWQAAKNNLTSAHDRVVSIEDDMPAAAGSVAHICRFGNYIDMAKEKFPSAAAMHACDDQRIAAQSIDNIGEILDGWFTLSLRLFERKSSDPVTDRKALYVVPTSASAVVTILGAAVLPVFYGLLGAGAAVVRGLSWKIRHSQLAPRDLHLSIQQLALGAVMGACIGLFVAGPSASGQPTPGLIATVALSSAALSFIAGFGVEHVFTALEALIRRVFLVDGPPTAKPGGR